jgi:hypothetical protein
MGILDKAIGFLGGGVSGNALLSGALGMLGTRSTNRAQEQLARQQMQFQAGQTGTEYQRAVADMRKAGINPMLATKLGGASSASGAMAQLRDPTASAREAMMIDAQVRNLDAQASKNSAQALTTVLGAIGGAGASAYALKKFLGTKSPLAKPQGKLDVKGMQKGKGWTPLRLEQINKLTGEVNRISIDPKGAAKGFIKILEKGWK